jgi:dTDP-4-dehydrorhamnose reductase
MAILLLGKTGQVGWELSRTLAPLGPVLAPGRLEVDLARPESIRGYLRLCSPRLIVNAAAYTAVDQAEAEADLAHAANATAPAILAEEAKRRAIPLVHYSTDYIFDGTKADPYTEGDPPNPLNVYGRTKLAGEDSIRASGADHLIFRTSWIYGVRGKNFLRTILRLATERECLRVVADQFGAPTWSRMIAEATAQVLARCRATDGDFHVRDVGGVYHLAAAGSASWFEFARAIIFSNPRGCVRKITEIQPIPSAEYPTRARRPANSRFDCTALRGAFGIALPDWQVSLQQVLEELNVAQGTANPESC